MLPTAKQLIVESAKLYRNNFRLFFTYMALLMLPAVPVVFMTLLSEFTLPNEYASLGIPFILLAIVLEFVSWWISLAFLRVLAQRAAGMQAEPMRAQLSFAGHRFWPVVLGTLLSGLIILGGFLLLIIPAILFAGWFVFVPYEILLSNASATEGLKGSRALVHGRWWPVVWRIMVPTVVFILLMLIAQQIMYVLLAGGLALVNSTGAILAVVALFTFLTAFVNLLLTPLLTAAPTLLYITLKQGK